MTISRQVSAVGGRRVRLGAGLIVAALLIGCSRSDEKALEELFAAARQDIWQGSLNQALARLDEADAAAGARGGWQQRLRLLRAEALILRRDFPGASAILNAAPPSVASSNALAAWRTSLQAQLQLARGMLTDALATLGAARDKAAAAAADDVMLDVDVLRGQALLRARRYDDAEAILQSAVERAAARGDAYRQAAALHNLGMGRVVRNRFDEALVFFERLLSFSDLEAYTVYGTAQTNAGLSYARLGQFERAIELQRRAVEGHGRRDLPIYLVQALGELGNTCFLQGDARESATYLSRAFDAASAASLAAEAALWAGNMATVSIQLGDLDRAERFNREAIRLKIATKGNTLFNTLNAAHIARHRGQGADAARLFGEVVGNSADEPSARWEAHAGLASTALASGNARLAATHFEKALSTIEQVRSDLLKAEYRLTFLARVIRFYQEYVDALVAAGDVARALEVADSSRAVVLAERMGEEVKARGPLTTASFVAAARRSGTVWLSYWLAPRQSYAWVIAPDGVELLRLPPAPHIERLVRRHQSAVERSTDVLAEAHSAGDALYAAIVEPALAALPPGSSVRIVADGALHSVNFETLPVAGPRRHYWIEDVTIAMAPSLALLASAPARAPLKGARSLLLVGDPTPRLREYPRLGYAQVEMASVSRHFDPSAIVRHDGDRASPAGFFEARPERFAVIHFTAHGAANRLRPLESAVILAGPAGRDKLYARDVADRALRAELVTISACRSAGETAYAGEGLVGFSWAFLRAGARQVVAGLWDVDDRSTAMLMDGLYAGIARGAAVPDALRAAKLALMQRGGHVARPYYWGPFEVFTISP